MVEMMKKNREYSIKELEVIASKIRGSLVKITHEGKAAHIGSALSCIDILVVLYWKVLNLDKDNITRHDRNRFIMSKGHGIGALYATLGFKKVFNKELLKAYCRPGSVLEEHPGPESPAGVEVASGSLGHGLSLGVGMALAGKMQKLDYTVTVLLSDGECNEGSVWEAAMYAKKRSLNRLCAIIDFNKWQATGRSCEVSGLEPFVDKWKAFGWDTYEIDGNSMSELVKTFKTIDNKQNMLSVVVAHTVKGKGISFMEDDNNWHYRVPDKKDVQMALKELERTNDE
jgi:transketolase